MNQVMTTESAYTPATLLLATGPAELQGDTCNDCSRGERLRLKERKMAKGQLRGNKEVKKPKKEKVPVAPAGSFMPQSKVPPK